MSTIMDLKMDNYYSKNKPLKLYFIPSIISWPLSLIFYELMPHCALHAICCSLLILNLQSMMPCVLLVSSLHVLMLSKTHPIKILFLVPSVLPLCVSVIILTSVNLLLIMTGRQIVFGLPDSIDLPYSTSSLHLL